VKIVDRKKDMILVSGFNVYPERDRGRGRDDAGRARGLRRGAPDETSGEVVRWSIVRKDPRSPKEQVLEHCKKHLTGYKIPKIVEFWKELPKTNVGKVCAAR
jgi:long-chain acyl-CoA synthetase